MVSPEILVTDIIYCLRELAEPERKELSKTYYPTQMEVIGVTVPNVRKILGEIKPELKKMDIADNVRLGQKLVETNIFECQQIAYEMIGKNKKLMHLISREEIIKLDKNQDNWVSVDTFSALILGVGWRLGKISDKEILEKCRSDNFWIRRQALVATLGWNQKARGGYGNSEKTLMICELFVDDHHDMINKALSWALRELSKVDRNAVDDFMARHGRRLSARVRREVKSKLDTGLKN